MHGCYLSVAKSSNLPSNSVLQGLEAFFFYSRNNGKQKQYSSLSLTNCLLEKKLFTLPLNCSSQHAVLINNTKLFELFLCILSDHKMIYEETAFSQRILHNDK